MEFDLNKRYCYYFKALADIPRGSGNEKAVSDYVYAFAKDLGLSAKQDEALNVIIRKPATAGYENSEGIIMQAHMDIVCEKNKDVEHDFEKDPLELYVEDGWLKARGTTLGADDGYGCAYMMAILEDNTLEHPALTCIFTTGEEVGLLGAMQIRPEELDGTRMINLDGGGESETTVSSAGGATTIARVPYVKEKNDKPAYFLGVRGLQGGHSGASIHLERGNANVIAVRILKELETKGIDVVIASVSGGLKFNAIPREADVVFVSEADETKICEAVREIEKNIQQELEFSDRGFSVVLKKTEAEEVLTKESSERYIRFLYLAPWGFQHRSLPLGITTASLNPGVVHMEDSDIVITYLVRSAIESYTDTMLEKLYTLGDLLGVDVKCTDRYAGWAYRENSPLREILMKTSADHGTQIRTAAAHGGLECGIFFGMKPELDIITYGPVAEGCHTPEERLDLASFDRCYAVLCDILKNAR